ncbi:MAG TPA: hypothetical protein VGS02_17595 [Acidobacteriaceae bacterium]|nr:hypothetical protein [Acidobacteriaceae bacterium]
MKWLVVAIFLASSAGVFAQKRYSNKQYGVSFTYPRGCVLKTGPLGPHDTGLGYLGPIPMEFAAPGGIRVATIEAPAGSYPGTDFVNAFFTLSVNPHMSRSECGQFADRRANLPKLELKTAAGLILHGVNESEAGLGHQASLQYYHVFSHDQCVELAYGLATAGLGAVDGMKPAPYQLIDSRFKAILLGVVISRPKSDAPAEQ